ncbi:MAG: C45 family autoproteolytic acyltransferase/hydrolase [Candidatus Hydrogenedentes bacterium]|nr:C45 family autoproteolytic acyltransferase/hydrolase [Candidatus Hydrogenedentota bacterium]
MGILHVRPSRRQTVRKSGEGFFEIYSSPLGDLPVVHVAGPRDQMGWQYGALVGDLIRRNADMTLGLFTQAGVPPDLVRRILDAAWGRLAPHVSDDVLAEIAAIPAGARSAGFNVAPEDIRRLIAVTNLDMYRRDERLPELLNPMPPAPSCTFFAAWGPRTQGGKLLASRNLDWVSQTGMHETRLVTAYRPEDGFGFVTMGYAGLAGALAGMNEKGICFSEIGAFSGSEELDGTPWTLTARKVLEQTDSLESAIAAVRGAKHTIGYNFMTADGDPGAYGAPEYAPGAAAFETNFTCCETFRADDPKEHDAAWRDPAGNVRPYGLPMKHAVMRADMAFSQSVRALQATDNGPVVPGNDGNPLTAPTYVDCHKPMYDMFRAYETGAEYVYPLRNTRVIEAAKPRLIGREQALNIAATVAHNVEKLDKNDWNVMSVVYAPTDLEFYVAFESRDHAGNWKNAPDSGYWQFNLDKLLG